MYSLTQTYQMQPFPALTLNSPLADLAFFVLISASFPHNPSASILAYPDSCMLPRDLLSLALVYSEKKP